MKYELDTMFSTLDRTKADREALYKYFHQHPELSMQEIKTSAKIASELDRMKIDYARIGKTGIVATISNGTGPCVCMRADIDALPLRETSAKPYASHAIVEDMNTHEQTPVAHGCGHDIHICSLLSALSVFNEHKDLWTGTFVGVFQPAEETAAGAQDMLKSGIAHHIPQPDVYLGQHVLATLDIGNLGTCAGPFLSQAFSLKATLYGKGAHGSMPELSIDPVVIAAYCVTRLQTIVSREISSSHRAVITVGSIKAGAKSNIIPDTAELLINVRTYDKQDSIHIQQALERIIKAECMASGCDKAPYFEYYDRYPLTSNDSLVTQKVAQAFTSYFGDMATQIEPQSASEDFSYIPDALGCPYTYWALGGFKDRAHAPANHNPAFAPDIQPTLDQGAKAIVVAACAWLQPNGLATSEFCK